MRPTEKQDQLEKARAERLAAESPLIEGVQNITVELGDDYDGDPSMWLIFNLQPGFDPNEQWIQRFVAYAREIQFKILHSGLARFPYTRFGQAA